MFLFLPFYYFLFSPSSLFSLFLYVFSSFGDVSSDFLSLFFVPLIASTFFSLLLYFLLVLEKIVLKELSQRSLEEHPIKAFVM